MVLSGISVPAREYPTALNGEFADKLQTPISPFSKTHYCKYFHPAGTKDVLDTIRFQQWRKDFDSLLNLKPGSELNTISVSSMTIPRD